MSHQQEVYLGFIEELKNTVVTQPQYTPSKIGGEPTWISPLNTPDLVCPKCKYKMSFLLQLYANIEQPQFYDYHRTIYVFLCVSEHCIQTSNAVKVFTCIVPHNNKLGIKFIEDDSKFNEIMKKTDNQLRAMGYQIPIKKIDEDSKKQEHIDDLMDAKKKNNQAALDKYYKRMHGDDDDDDDDGWEDVSDGNNDVVEKETDQIVEKSGQIEEKQIEEKQIVEKKMSKQDLQKEEWAKNIKKQLDEKKIVFQKEFWIDSDQEIGTVTRFYCKQSYKILKELYGIQEVLQAAKRSQMHFAEQSESDLDDDGELVDQMFGLQNFNEASEFDNKHAEKLLKLHQQEMKKHNDKELEQMLSEEKQNQQTTEQEVESIEQMINESVKDDQVCKTYKLFNYVLQQYPEQVIRYVPPLQPLSKYSILEPLWATQKNRLAHKDVPCCPRCQKPMVFELQIMPQLFYFIDELKFVDWDTIAIYTCQNLKCLPDFDKSEYYKPEFGYIQVSEDFANVKYGDEKEIEAQKKFNQKILEQEMKQMEQEAANNAQLPKVEEEKVNEEDEQKNTDEQKKKKKKKKNKNKDKGDEGATVVTQQDVNNEVQEELGALLNEMNLGGPKAGSKK